MPKAIVFDNANILDVAAGAIAPDYQVVVEGDHIVDLQKAGAPAQAARRLDLKGRTLMPGLCDAHVHVTAFTPDFAALGRMAPTYTASRAARILKDMLMRGFTTVRDAGGADYGLARALTEGVISGPRLLYCGKALSQTGGHGDMRSPDEGAPSCDCGVGLGFVCDGPYEVRRACRDAVRKGAHHIKLMASGGVTSPTDRINSTQFSEEEIRAAVEEADAAGIYCMAHAYTPRAITRAVNAGVRSIEHGNLLDANTAMLMREKNVFLVPTLSTYPALAAQGDLSNDAKRKLAEVGAHGVNALSLAAEAGVSIAFGSDLLGSMHERQLTEFAIRSGLQSNLEIIRGATTIAADLFGLQHQIGMVKPGACADLIVVEGNPIADLACLQNPQKFLPVIMRQGVLAKCEL